MAAHDFHENSFFFKAITFVRIIAGVAVTLAVLFAMVWLIDYSSPRTAVPRNQQPLLVPDRADETAERAPRTFFETLLNTAREKKADDAGRDGTAPEPVLPALRAGFQQACALFQAQMTLFLHGGLWPAAQDVQHRVPARSRA